MWASVVLPLALHLSRGRPPGKLLPFPWKAATRRRGRGRKEGGDPADNSREESDFSHKLSELLPPLQFPFLGLHLSSEGHSLKPLQGQTFCNKWKGT